MTTPRFKSFRQIIGPALLLMLLASCDQPPVTDAPLVCDPPAGPAWWDPDRIEVSCRAGDDTDGGSRVVFHLNRPLACTGNCPVVVDIHSTFADHNAALHLSRSISYDNGRMIVIRPQNPLGDIWNRERQFPLIPAFINQVLDGAWSGHLPPADPDRVSAMGYSEGARAAWYLACLSGNDPDAPRIHALSVTGMHIPWNDHKLDLNGDGIRNGLWPAPGMSLAEGDSLPDGPEICQVRDVNVLIVQSMKRDIFVPWEADVDRMSLDPEEHTWNAGALATYRKVRDDLGAVQTECRDHPDFRIERLSNPGGVQFHVISHRLTTTIDIAGSGLGPRHTGHCIPTTSGQRWDELPFYYCRSNPGLNWDVVTGAFFTRPDGYLPLSVPGSSNCLGTELPGGSNEPGFPYVYYELTDRH